MVTPKATLLFIEDRKTDVALASYGYAPGF